MMTGTMTTTTRYLFTSHGQPRIGQQPDSYAGSKKVVFSDTMGLVRAVANRWATHQDRFDARTTFLWGRTHVALRECRNVLDSLSLPRPSESEVLSVLKSACARYPQAHTCYDYLDDLLVGIQLITRAKAVEGKHPIFPKHLPPLPTRDGIILEWDGWMDATRVVVFADWLQEHHNCDVEASTLRAIYNL